MYLLQKKSGNRVQRKSLATEILIIYLYVECTRVHLCIDYYIHEHFYSPPPILMVVIISIWKIVITESMWSYLYVISLIWLPLNIFQFHLVHICGRLVLQKSRVSCYFLIHTGCYWLRS